MSLYGINAYTSNSYYSALLANKNGSSLLNSMSANKNNSLSDMLSNAFKTDKNDLYALAKKVDLVRSRSYQKELIEGFKEYFYGTGESEEADTAAAENAEKLSESSKSLNKNAGALATGSEELYKDPEKSAAAIKDFVDSYNSTIDSLKSSENLKALEKGASIVNTVKAYSRTLDRIGITMGSDNRLSVDADKLKQASPTTLKSLFAGNYSLSTRIADKASYINRSVALENAVSYNSKGNRTDYFKKLSASMMFNDRV